MDDEQVNEIMDNIFEDNSLCIIRDALTQYETEKKAQYRIVACLKDGRNVLLADKFDNKAEAETFTGLLHYDDFDEELEKAIVCEVL